ncbi:MAG: hypothetical protein EOP34_06085 [Rickettsiales bacterium]|nr:MAG: hypothetical protein EOP34_06085 [Rickettsiales bacterium]
MLFTVTGKTIFLLKNGCSNYIVKPHQFTSICLESSIFHTIINHIAIMIRRDLKQGIIYYTTNIVLSRSKKYKVCIILQGVIAKFNDLFTLYIKITDFFLSIISFRIKVRYPLVYNIYLALKNEYLYIIKGDLNLMHIQLFIGLGFFVGSVDYFY